MIGILICLIFVTLLWCRLFYSYVNFFCLQYWLCIHNSLLRLAASGTRVKPLACAATTLYSRLPIRCLYSSSSRAAKSQFKPDSVPIYFILRDDTKVKVDCRVGDCLRDIVVYQKVRIDGFGVCGGALACSTCHLIFDKTSFDSSNEITEEEQYMLKSACDVTDTSRLSCQIVVTPNMKDWVIRVPKNVADARGSKN